LHLLFLPFTLRVNRDQRLFVVHLEQYQLLLCPSERSAAVSRIIPPSMRHAGSECSDSEHPNTPPDLNNGPRLP
jgi:hypothetical protein